MSMVLHQRNNGMVLHAFSFFFFLQAGECAWHTWQQDNKKTKQDEPDRDESEDKKERKRLF